MSNQFYERTIREWSHRYSRNNCLVLKLEVWNFGEDTIVLETCQKIAHPSSAALLICCFRKSTVTMTLFVALTIVGVFPKHLVLSMVHTCQSYVHMKVPQIISTRKDTTPHWCRQWLTVVINSLTSLLVGLEKFTMLEYLLTVPFIRQSPLEF